MASYDETSDIHKSPIPSLCTCLCYILVNSYKVVLGIKRIPLFSYHILLTLMLGPEELKTSITNIETGMDRILVIPKQ